MDTLTALLLCRKYEAVVYFYRDSAAVRHYAKDHAAGDRVFKAPTFIEAVAEAAKTLGWTTRG